MGGFRLKTWTMGVALVAAYMLVLQGLLGAFALGAAHAGPLLDAFGNPLCVTSEDAAGPGPGSPGHAVPPDCCAVACGMFAPAAADEPAPHSLVNPLSAAPAAIRVPAPVAAPAFALERGPGSPRSPPSTV